MFSIFNKTTRKSLPLNVAVSDLRITEISYYGGLKSKQSGYASGILFAPQKSRMGVSTLYEPFAFRGRSTRFTIDWKRSLICLSPKPHIDYQFRKVDCKELTQKCRGIAFYSGSV
jgi:hypothetical protein